MNKEITHCLLCATLLNERINWRTLLTNAFPKTICSDCENKFEPYYQPPNENLVCLYQYNDAMKDYLHRYKFMHDVVLAKVFRDKIHQAIRKTTATIIPIPIHPFKLKERTFAHVDELLEAANIPYQHFLEKITAETQSSKSRNERINTSQIFKLKENAHEIKGKEVIVVDDIFTTGTTIKHATSLLREAEVKSVKVFTLIRG